MNHRSIARYSLALALGLGSILSAEAQSPQADFGQRQPLMDRQREIALALSACPAPVASKAAIYVLGESGYLRVRESENGFTAIVQHSQPISQEPRCMDAEGTRTHLPRILKVAELRAAGKSSEEIDRYVADAFAKGVFQPPTRPGVDYMLSPEILIPGNNGGVQHFPPHVMFYAPYLTNVDIGSDGNPGGRIFVVGEGTPHALIIVPLGDHATGHQTAGKEKKQ